MAPFHISKIRGHFIPHTPLKLKEKVAKKNHQKTLDKVKCRGYSFSTKWYKVVWSGFKWLARYNREGICFVGSTNIR